MKKYGRLMKKYGRLNLDAWKNVEDSK